MSGPTRRRFLTSLGAAGLAATAGCVTADSPTYEGTWSRRGYDDARTGFSPADGPTGDLYVAWRTDVFGGYPTSSPVVADGTVYHLHTREYGVAHETVVSAFDATSGEELWRTVVTEAETHGPASHHDSVVVADGRVYVRSFDGLHALSTDGRLRWTHPVPTTGRPYPRTAPPVVSGGLVVTATYGERIPPVGVVAVDAETGDPVWRAGFASRRRPLMLSAAGGTVYVPFRGGEAGLVALDLETGARKWERSLPVGGPVTVAGDTLLVPLDGDPGFVAALDRRSREIRWRKPASRRTPAGIAVAEGLVYYVADGAFSVRRLDTGKAVWSFDPAASVAISWTPVVAGSVVYVPALTDAEDPKQYLYAFDARTGSTLGRGPIPFGQMRESIAVVDGAVYLAHRNELRCLESCALTVGGRCLVG
ncbi:PQQ-binding-like beta-propeller repeat protein [Haloferax prahovense]|uniref:outer membrane protein assembly factor BamB family protein n=1 Tax=Haloferax TaxID=2251 RepID=UPI0009ECA896|nr:PQQ-binding-like beta-propeller repeat protein [Haloferax sp. Q22]